MRNFQTFFKLKPLYLAGGCEVNLPIIHNAKVGKIQLLHVLTEDYYACEMTEISQHQAEFKQKIIIIIILMKLLNHLVQTT